MAYPQVQHVYWLLRNSKADLYYTLYDEDWNRITKANLETYDEIVVKLYDRDGVEVWEGTLTATDISILEDADTKGNVKIEISPDDTLTFEVMTYSISIELRVTTPESNKEYIFEDNIKVSEHKIMYTPKIFPLTHDFGDVVVGNPATPQIFTVLNTTKTDITITDISVTGADAVDFVASPTGVGSWAVVANGGTLAITVTFTPSHIGIHNAILTITYGGGTLSVTLAGTGV